ncbi:MAG: hypothetical protein J5449_01715 [Oscillospiraceae bacterium]|nr:hypothetical protein [Oscillospiraceae bacterium]
MDAKDAESLLTQLLEERGADWTRENGYIRFRLRRGGMRWEADCLCDARRIVIYGRMPFSVGDVGTALELCNRASLRMTRGAMLLPDDGVPTCRTTADVEDIYDAAFRLREALEENAGAVTRWWGGFERLAAADTRQ